MIGKETPHDCMLVEIEISCLISIGGLCQIIIIIGFCPTIVKYEGFLLCFQELDTKTEIEIGQIKVKWFQIIDIIFQNKPTIKYLHSQLYIWK